jgi:hypothetical protein
MHQNFQDKDGTVDVNGFLKIFSHATRQMSDDEFTATIGVLTT